MADKKVDLHKLAGAVGWQPLYVDDGYTCYEYVQKIRNIESLCHVLQIKDDLTYQTYLPTFLAIVAVLPPKLQKKVKKLTKKSSEEKIDSVLDLACYAVEEFKGKCEYTKLQEYGNLVGVDITKQGYQFSYYLPKNVRSQILSLIESSLPVTLAPTLGKIKKVEYKIGHIKQHGTT